MITQSTPLQKQIEFYENKIECYLNVVKGSPIGETCKLWIEWITDWNNEIIELKNRLREQNNPN